MDNKGMKKIVINKVPHQIIKIEHGGIYVDCKEVPGRPCSFHRMSEHDIRMLKLGYGLQTNGNNYQLSLH
jgi:hypothetical protein